MMAESLENGSCSTITLQIVTSLLNSLGFRVGNKMTFTVALLFSVQIGVRIITYKIYPYLWLDCLEKGFLTS